MLTRQGDASAVARKPHLPLALRGEEPPQDLVQPHRQLQGGHQPRRQHQREEGPVVGQSHTVVQPVAVVVERMHAAVAPAAVLAAHLHICLRGSSGHPVLSQLGCALAQ